MKYFNLSRHAVHVQVIKGFQKKTEKKISTEKMMVRYSVPAELRDVTRCEEMIFPSNAKFYETTI